MKDRTDSKVVDDLAHELELKLIEVEKYRAIIKELRPIVEAQMRVKTGKKIRISSEAATALFAQ
jgi:hypothetical protein